MSRVRSSRQAAAPLAMFLLCLAGCGNGSSGEAADEAAEPVVVLGRDDVAVATMSDVAAGVIVTGTLDPSEVVEIKAQVAGTIQNLRADRGVPVKRGQRLATIEAEGVRSQVAGAEANLAAGQSAIAAAEANLATAKQRLEGARTLYDAGAMSAVDFQTAQAQYEAAEGQLAAARAQAAAAKAQLTGASETARRTTVLAPITGVVSQRPVSEGEAVNVGQVLYVVVNAERLELSGQIPVQQAGLVQVGQEVSFTLDAYPGEVFTGTVARIDPVADPATRRVGIWLELPNPGGRLVAGQFVTGSVVTANVRTAVTIPRTALREDDTGQYVLAIDNDRIVRRDVQIVPVAISATNVAIESGLDPGTRVVVAPAADIPVGARVRQPDQTQPAREPG